MNKTNTIIKRYEINRPMLFRTMYNRVFSSYVARLKDYKFYMFEWNSEEMDSQLFYSRDTTDIDFFSMLDDIEIKNLKTLPNYFWVFDQSMEAEFLEFWFECITNSAIKHDIPFNKICLITSNLLGEKCYREWRATDNVVEEFNILSIDYWSTSAMAEVFNNHPTLDQTVNDLRLNNNKYFLSLNRRCKNFRIWTTMLLYQSNIFDQGLISADMPTFEQINMSKYHWQKNNGQALDNTKFKNYLDSLPWVLDRSNFKDPSNDDFREQWAWTNPVDLYKNTFFSAVSESLDSDINGSVLFFTEKSFKPMLHNHPILIFGQPGANSHLKKIGYRTYDKYFNLNFDLLQNPVERLKSQIVQLELTCNMLDKLTIEDKIEWLLQDRETLIYNKNQLFEQSYNKTKLEEFITKLEKCSSIN